MYAYVKLHVLVVRLLSSCYVYMLLYHKIGLFMLIVV